ncbi:hypothetical protein JCM17845_06020 [Iodidimonas gelatinilytica]|uniref:Uncharacterized protein n=1 Tax=Iodidimonas gelatinilytica TaxID=1236966 RepID=A0A5A7MYA1_9PROT|nr:YdbH domain-containing protein [Iodidimonas gelatinilytica]GEQ99978.1 hypothetical protein JCM17845_06020 [Iodidimonas gelatinilytica]
MAQSARKRIYRAALWAVACLCLFLVAGFLASSFLLRMGLTQALLRAGFEQVDIQRVQIQWGEGVRIGRIALGRADEALLFDSTARFDLSDILEGRVQSLDIRRIQADVAADAEGSLNVAGYHLAMQGQSDQPFFLPLDRLTIGTAHIALSLTGTGPVEVTVDDAALEQTVKGTHLTAAIHAKHDLAVIEGGLLANLSPTGALQTLRFDLAQGAMQAQDGVEGRVEGWAMLDVPHSRIEADLRLDAPSAHATLRVSNKVGEQKATGRLEATSTDLALLSPMLAGAGEMAGEFVLDWAEGPPTASMDTLSAQLRDLGFEGMHIPFLSYEGRMVGSQQDLRLDGALMLDAEAVLPDLRLDGLHLDAPAIAIEANRHSLRLWHEGCMVGRITQMDVSGYKAGPLQDMCFKTQGSDPLLVWDLDDQSGRLDMIVPSHAFALDVQNKAGKSQSLEGTLPQIIVAANGSVKNGLTASIDLFDGQVISDDVALVASGLSGQVVVTDKGLQSAALTLEKLASLDPMPVWAPVSLDLKATPGRQDGVFAFEGWASDLLGIFVLEASGEAGLAGGAAHLTLYPVQFLPDVAQIGDIAPAYGDVFTNVSGLLGFTGDLSWGEDGDIRSSGHVSLTDAAFETSGMAVSGLNGEIALRSLWPLDTAPDQRLTIDQLMAGVLLQKGEAVFQLTDNTQLSISDLHFSLAGGRLYTDSFIMDLSRPGDLVVVLNAEGVRVTEVMMMGGVDGLTGDGLINGRVPVTLAAGGLKVEDARLEATDNGVLRYNPGDVPGFLQGEDMRSQMLRQALQNFHYNVLSLSFAGDFAGSQSMQLAARGANPDFLDGHPIELNFNLQGALVGAVESAMGAGRSQSLESLFKRAQKDKPADSPQ